MAGRGNGPARLGVRGASRPDHGYPAPYRQSRAEPERLQPGARAETEEAADFRGFFRYRTTAGLRQAGLLHHLGGVVLDHLLDAFADGQALEADHFGAGSLEHGL